MKPKFSVYIASSLDGFIARKDGSFDWLEFDSPDASGAEDSGADGSSADDSGAESSSADASGADASDAEDYGFAEFIETVDLLLMGRHTYETLLTFDEWVYGDTELMVLSSTLGPEAIPARHEGKVSIASGTPHEILADLTEKGVRHVYVDGGITLQAFIHAGLIDEITISIIPVLIGEGIPLFGPLAGDLRLHHVSTRSFPSGLVQVKYRTFE
jgi:dihydrofolate reductase